jgi:DNA-directed RNA polymerase subunit RPC12/RpoP
MKRIYICSDCAYSHHVVLPCIEGRGISYSHVIIDGERYNLLHFIPARGVKCSECGRRSWEVFVPASQVEQIEAGQSPERRSKK